MENQFSQPKSRKIAIILALLGIVTPIAGVHKFYLKQPVWGVVYLLLCFTPIPRVACAVEVFWYLVQDSEEFNCRFNQGAISTTHLLKNKIPEINPKQVNAVADALRELEQLRQEGLISEYEFEQKRRQLLEHIA